MTGGHAATPLKPSQPKPLLPQPHVRSSPDRVRDERDGKALVREDFYFFGARTSGFWVPPSTAPLWLIEPAPVPSRSVGLVPPPWVEFS